MNAKQKLLVGVIFLCALLLPALASAQNFLYTPYMILGGEYNDNILFLRNDKIDDFLLNVAPALEVDYSSELFELNSLASIILRRYLQENEYDREDYYFDLNGKYRMTEKMILKGKLNYVKDYTLESTPTDLGESDIDLGDNLSDQGIERFNSERNRYKARAAMLYQLTELSDLGLRYRYLKNEYDFEENNDFSRNIFDLTFSRSLKSQIDQVGPRFSYTQSSSDVSEYDSYNLALTWRRNFTENMSLYTDIGVRYTEETFIDGDEDDNTWAGTADISLTRRGETNVLDIGFYQDVGMASNGRPENVSRFYCRLNQSISERLFFDLKGDFYITDEENYSSFDNASVYFDIIPSLRYMMTENHSVRLAYSYTIDYDRSLEDNRDKQRNRVWIAFEFGFPKTL